MKLADWAKKNGVTYITAYRWFRAGILPLPSQQLPTGTILVQELPTPTNNVALYARVSSAEQKSELEAQIVRLRDYAAKNGLHVVKEIAETGSGLNGHRRRLMKLLSDPSISTIAVEHRDRLARFGAEYIEAALASGGRKVLVMNESELKDDLVQDMIDVLVSFCARLYGPRAAKNRVEKAKAALL